MQTSVGQHHFHVRKRIYQNLEQFPHPESLKNFFDKLIVFIALMAGVMTIPQVAQVWVFKHVAGVSLLTWCGYFIASVFWVTYGLLHKEKIIIYSNILNVFLNFFVVAGILFYR